MIQSQKSPSFYTQFFSGLQHSKRARPLKTHTHGLNKYAHPKYTHAYPKHALTPRTRTHTRNA